MRTETVTFHDEGWTCMRYHRTVVAKCRREPGEDQTKVILNTGGWFTPTTKKRMNQFAEDNGLRFQVYQQDFEWFVDLGSWFKPDAEKIPFESSTVEFAL